VIDMSRWRKSNNGFMRERDIIYRDRQRQTKRKRQEQRVREKEKTKHTSKLQNHINCR
jgi:hypothetical protein